MAETTYLSPGVFSSEIDLTGQATSQPVGTPAGVIGTAQSGPAFIPLTVGNWSDFTLIYGGSNAERFGPIAVYQFLRNATALTYLRVLGIGDGKKRSASTGVVTNAGYEVGSKQVQAGGLVGRNPYAVDGGILGRTYFLGAYMLETAASSIFSDAGISHGVTSSMILRGVLMAPSGVHLTLSSCIGPSSQPSNTNPARNRGTTSTYALAQQGYVTGTVDIANKQFVMLLNGHINDPESDSLNVLTASFGDPEEGSYFANVFNTDADLIEQKGHYLYTHYDIHSSEAVVTGTGILDANFAFPRGVPYGTANTVENSAFLVTGSAARDTFSATAPNYESYEERFTNASSPYVISQKYGSKQWDLFRIHALDDGDSANGRFKISIKNITPSNSTTNKYGTFDLVIRDIRDDDINGMPTAGGVGMIKSFLGVTLDPTSDQFIGRAVGDMNTYFDFDQALDSQKIVMEGSYPIKNEKIRLELGSDLKNGKIPADALPMGFRGINHLVTSGSNPLGGVNVVSGSGFVGTTGGGFATNNVLKQTLQPPLQFRKNIKDVSTSTTANSLYYWGINFNRVTSVTDPNASDLFDTTIYSLNKFFPSYGKSNMDFSVGNNPGKADSNGIILDADRFNKNLFTLENIKVRTGSTAISSRADSNEWVSASYVRGGSIPISDADGTRAFKPDDLKESGNRTYAQFSFMLQGGFNGSNIFNKSKYDMTGHSVRREMVDSTNQGGTSGPTVAAYRKAIDIMGTKADVEINILTIPGIRHAGVMDYAITSVESRFDSILIMDIEEKDDTNSYITGSGEFSNITYTVSDFKDRNLDSSFAAVYFPDVNLQDPTTPSVSVQCPTISCSSRCICS